MRVSTSQVFRNGVESIQRSQQEVSRTQLQLGSGKRILSPSDDPSGAVKSLQLTNAVGKLEQYERNALAVTQRLRSTETVLTSVVDGMQRVRELVVQGNNGSQTSETRTMIASEIAQVREELLQLANSQDANGEYLFAGLRSSEKPFVANTETGAVIFEGNGEPRSVQISAVRFVPVGDSGATVFGDVGDGSLFELYAEIVSFLENGSESFHEDMGQALGDLDLALGRLLETRTSLGARMNTVETQSRINEDQLLQVKTALSEIQDLDYAEAIGRFNLQQTALQAAQQTFVQVQRLSLFNFL